MSDPAGIFSGMFSAPYPTDDEVVAELGDKFLDSLVAAVRGARNDLNDMRGWRPGWFPTMHARCLSNLIHDRMWAHLVTLIDSDADANIIEVGPTREIALGIHLRLRIKRHLAGDRISTYPTRTAIEFWRQNTDTLPGLEEVRIAVGYRWDRELREIEAPVVSLRDGKDNVIWAIELSEPAEGEKVSWKPIEPTLPTIDLGDLASDAEDDEGEASTS
ncbi:hypothetical protein MYSE111917_01160 [Mycobacterium senriense]